MSAGRTSRVVEPLVRWLWPDVTEEALYAIHVAVRKCAHLAEYALLALLAYRAARGGRAPAWRARWAATAVGIAAGFAVVDELRQSLTATRTGSPGDVAIDAAGAALAMLALRAVLALRDRVNTDLPDRPADPC